MKMTIQQLKEGFYAYVGYRADYMFAERELLCDEVLALIESNKPALLEQKKVSDRILNKIMDYVDTFVNVIDEK